MLNPKLLRHASAAIARNLWRQVVNLNYDRLLYLKLMLNLYCNRLIQARDLLIFCRVLIRQHLYIPLLIHFGL